MIQVSNTFKTSESRLSYSWDRRRWCLRDVDGFPYRIVSKTASEGLRARNHSTTFIACALQFQTKNQQSTRHLWIRWLVTGGICERHLIYTPAKTFCQVSLAHRTPCPGAAWPCPTKGCHENENEPTSHRGLAEKCHPQDKAGHLDTSVQSVHSNLCCVWKIRHHRMILHAFSCLKQLLRHRFEPIKLKMESTMKASIDNWR